MLTINLDELQIEYRIPPREKECRQYNYIDLFDSNTFAYDVFSRNGKTYIITPPNTDNTWNKVINLIRINNKKINSLKHKLYKDKIHKLIINIDANHIEWSNNYANIDKRPNTFKKRNKILYTLQKDNDIQWIQDWINWHKTKHKIDTVIIYDNASTKYSIDQLKCNLKDDSLEIIIENCPYKFGPGAFNGSRWDSDYLQYAMYEQVRYYHCNEKSKIINADIDELVVCKNDTPIFNLLNEPKSIVFYPGKWIDVQATNNTTSEKLMKHKDHTIIDKYFVCPNKWTANLDGLNDSTFLRIHDYTGDRSIKKITNKAIYLHHRCITTNWKYKRSKHISINNKNYIHYTNSTINEILK